MRVPLMAMPSSPVVNFCFHAESVFYFYYAQEYYTLYAVRSMSGNGCKGKFLRHSVSVSKTVEDPCGFYKWLIGKELLNRSPDIFFTHDIATNESPGVKSFSLRSITALSNVKP
jgi:hypothetical protein